MLTSALTYSVFLSPFARFVYVCVSFYPPSSHPVSSSDESVKSLEGQLLGNSVMTELDRQQQQPHLPYYQESQSNGLDLLQQEYDDARAYDQLVTALEQQLWSRIQQQRQQQQDPPIHVVQRSRILYPEEMTSAEVRNRLNSHRRFPAPPPPGSRYAPTSSQSGNKAGSKGHEQQKRPETQRLISGSGVSGLANFLTQSYGLGKDGSIGVRFGLS